MLFDCDGVLVDTEAQGHRMSFNKAFQQKGKLLGKLVMLKVWLSRHNLIKLLLVLLLDTRTWLAGLQTKWSLEQYGELLRIGGGKERMTNFFSQRPDEEPFKSRQVRQFTAAALLCSVMLDLLLLKLCRLQQQLLCTIDCGAGMVQAWPAAYAAAPVWQSF